MKKFIFLIITISIVLIGCGDTENSNTTRFRNTGEVYLINGKTYAEVVDTKTKIIYITSGSDGNYGKSFSPLYKTDGTLEKEE